MSISKNNERLDFLEENEVANRELVFGYLSIDIIKDNITIQIDSLKESIKNINYIDVFKSKFDYVLSIVDLDDIDLMDSIKNSKIEFYEFVFNKICKIINLRFDLPFSYSLEEKFQIIEDLYNYFICKINVTISNYIINDMIENEKNIIKGFKNTINKKEIYFNMLKKDLGTDYAVIVNSIEKYIDTLEINNIEEFIEDSYVIRGNAPESYRDSIKNLFIDEDNSLLNINFNKNTLLELIKNLIENEPIILLNVKNELYNYYLHKKNK